MLSKVWESPHEPPDRKIPLLLLLQSQVPPNSLFFLSLGKNNKRFVDRQEEEAAHRERKRGRGGNVLACSEKKGR